ncbi:MAG: glucose 1-dehydrogenase [Blastocatellia bacterium]
MSTETRMREFNDIEAGDAARLRKTITAEAVEAFAEFSGDWNPLHLDEAFARGTSFHRRVAHGMIVASYVSTLVGMHLPGPGALWAQQNFRWRAPVFIGDELEITLTVRHKSEGTRTLTVEVAAVNQNNQVVMEGEGTVMVLEERKVARDLPLGERVALVTGSSRGIGAAIAQSLAASGASVVINYIRNRSAASDLRARIDSEGGRAIAVQADITDPAAVSRLVEQARESFGKPVDVLINNASGAIQAKPFIETEWNEIHSHLETQLRGAFNCARAVLPAMIAAGSGRIVNIGSISAWNAPPVNQIGYVTAKAALRAFTKALAAELGPKGIRVNMVSPGMTETDLISDVPERLRKVQAMQTPLRRLATTEDVARTVQFLCSDAAEFINGADIPVCGGITM